MGHRKLRTQRRNKFDPRINFNVDELKTTIQSIFNFWSLHALVALLWQVWGKSSQFQSIPQTLFYDQNTIRMVRRIPRFYAKRSINWKLTDVLYFRTPPPPFGLSFNFQGYVLISFSRLAWIPYWIHLIGSSAVIKGFPLAEYQFHIPVLTYRLCLAPF